MARTFALVLALGATATAQTPDATFRPAHLFGSHMVVPVGDLPIWGFGPPGAKVAIAASWGADAEATIAADGHWRGTLRVTDGNGPQTVTLRCGDATVQLDDVLVGDVWLGSGQSNMEMPVGKGWFTGVVDCEREIATANHPELRLFTVARGVAGTPRDDIDGQWQVCSPATVGTFSAAAYFFGRELQAHGHRPLGLVVSSWGGTVAEAWTSADGLSGFPEFAATIAQVRAPSTPREAQLTAFWRAVAAAPNGAVRDVEVPELWSRSDLAHFDGVATYTRTVTLPPAFRGQDLWLELGALDDMDTTTWNGRRIGGFQDDGAWSTERRYAIAASDNRDAEAQLAVRVVDTGGEGGFSADAAAVRLVLASDPTQTLPLAGTWQRTCGAAMADLPPWPREAGNPNRATVLHNAMIAPLAPFPFTGAIWYQGEANRGRAAQYARLMPALVRDWRRAFARELPFYCVQIAPYDYAGDPADLTPELREAQGALLALPHTGMAITLDCGDAHDIHPADKQTVGKRLALLALADHYGESIACSGPTVRDVALAGAALRVTFDHAEGLALANDGAGFELAGSDGRFVPAQAMLDGDAIVLTADGVPTPWHVRYAWAPTPGWSLRNAAGLPAGPFRATVR